MPELADVIRFRQNPKAMASFLSKAFERNDLDECLMALNRVMRAQNVRVMAQEKQLSRERLYKTFDGKREPLLGSVLALFSALGIVLTVKAVAPDDIPQLKLGRRPRGRRSLNTRRLGT